MREEEQVFIANAKGRNGQESPYTQVFETEILEILLKYGMQAKESKAEGSGEEAETEEETNIIRLANVRMVFSLSVL